MSTIAGKGCPRIIPDGDKKPLQDIERSIVKTYRKHIWSKFVKAVKDYNLIEEGDKIAVGISGGKDSYSWQNYFRSCKDMVKLNSK